MKVELVQMSIGGLPRWTRELFEAWIDYRGNQRPGIISEESIIAGFEAATGQKTTGFIER